MKRRILVGILVSALLCGLLGQAVFAAAGEYQDVTVTATPAFVEIEVDNTTWTLNDIVGDGVSPKGTITDNDIYYANPQGDGTPPSATVASDEGYFAITNTSSCDIELVVDMEDFSGGDANMTNGETGSPGASSYGAYSWYEGMTYTNKVVVKTHGTGSDTLWTSSSPGQEIDIGVEVATQTGAFTGGDSSTSTMKISASAHVA